MVGRCETRGDVVGAISGRTESEDDLNRPVIAGLQDPLHGAGEMTLLIEDRHHDGHAWLMAHAGKGSLGPVRSRIPLIAGAVIFGGGLAAIGILAGWPPAVVAVAAGLALIFGAVLGQVAAWVRTTAGRQARMEHVVSHRLEGLKGEITRRTDTVAKAQAGYAKSTEKHLAEVRKRISGVESQLTFPKSTYRQALRELAHNQSAERREARGLFQQKLDDQVALLEAFVQLQRLVPTSLPMPRPGTWAASEDLLLWLAGYVLEKRPALVVDLGSGQSSVWMAAAMRTAGYAGRVVGVDHEEQFAEATIELGRRQGVLDWLTVIHAPLMVQTIDGREVTWYDASALDGLADVTVLCVDGPPGQGNPMARWPALPFFHDRMAAGGVVVLDDMIRADEQAIAADWKVRYPDLVGYHLDFEKGAEILTLPA